MPIDRNTPMVLLLAFASTEIASSQTVGRAVSEQQFIGMWRLVSWTKEYEDGPRTQDPRTDSYLVYTDTGRMCWVAMDPSRPKLSANPTESEEAAAYRGLGAYCAAVEINLDDGYVVHHVDVAKLPNAVGIERKRWFGFAGPDELHLRVDPAENVAPLVETVLVWERVK